MITHVSKTNGNLTPVLFIFQIHRLPSNRQQHGCAHDGM